MSSANPADPVEPGYPALQSAFSALRRELAGHDTPPAVEQALLAAFARQHQAPPWHRRLLARPWRLAGGLGLGLSLCLTLVLALHTPAPVGRIDARALVLDDGADFIALESLERIEHEPNTRMLETALPRTALVSMGVAVSPENAGELVRAEMLVADDGQPLALRLTSLE